jgi:hypothetical protein
VYLHPQALQRLKLPENFQTNQPSKVPKQRDPSFQAENSTQAQNCTKHCCCGKADDKKNKKKQTGAARDHKKRSQTIEI